MPGAKKPKEEREKDYPDNRLPRGNMLRGKPERKNFVPTTWEELSPLMRRFIYQYPIDHDIAAAMERAGSRAKRGSMQSIGGKWLRVPFIAKMIEEREKEIADEAKVTATRILKEMARVAFLDIRELFDDNGDLLPVKEMPEDAARALGGLEVIEQFSRDGKVSEGFLKKLKVIDKKGMLDSLAKIRGMFVDKQEVETGNNLTKLLETISGATRGLPNKPAKK